MEKILLALDARRLNTPSIDFACYLANLTGSRLTGIFLENLVDTAIPDSMQLSHAGAIGGPVTAEEVSAVTEENIRLFREACVCRGVPARVHRDRGVPLKEVVEESRFADLIVLDAETSFNERHGGAPSQFVKEVLTDAECPIILAPYNFERIDELFFAYNGTRSSVFAIKQFAYLFPELRTKKISVVSVREDGESYIEESFKMKEWLESHYMNVEYEVLKGDATDELFGYLLEKKNGIAVMGSYGRGILSRKLKSSHAKLILKSVNLPVFITHM